MFSKNGKREALNIFSMYHSQVKDEKSLWEEISRLKDLAIESSKQTSRTRAEYNDLLDQFYLELKQKTMELSTMFQNGDLKLGRLKKVYFRVYYPSEALEPPFYRYHCAFRCKEYGRIWSEFNNVGFFTEEEGPTYINLYKNTKVRHLEATEFRGKTLIRVNKHLHYHYDKVDCVVMIFVFTFFYYAYENNINQAIKETKLFFEDEQITVGEAHGEFLLREYAEVLLEKYLYNDPGYGI